MKEKITFLSSLISLVFSVVALVLFWNHMACLPTQAEHEIFYNQISLNITIMSALLALVTIVTGFLGYVGYINVKDAAIKVAKEAAINIAKVAAEQEAKLILKDKVSDQVNAALEPTRDAQEAPFHIKIRPAEPSSDV